MADDQDRRLTRILSVGNVYPPHLLGGYEVIWKGVTLAARAAGHAERVLCTDYRAPGVDGEASELADVHRELRWYWRDHEWPPMTPLERWRLERHNALTFDRHVHEFKPDVVAWWAMGGMSLSLIERARRAGLPAVLFVLDYWPVYGPERDLWLRAWATRPGALRRLVELTGIPTRVDLADAGRWLFCSDAAREETLNNSGLEPADEGILRPGVSSAFLGVPREAEAPEWRWRIAYIGRVVEQKGVRVAIEAISRLPVEARLRIIGDGDEPYRLELEGLARELGVAERVSFEPPRHGEELFAAYREADVIVFPVQWTEPWGLVPLEAMALGRLVVATGQGGSGEFLGDRVNSLLFPVADPSALAQALMALAEDSSLRERLRTAGYETARRHSDEAFNDQAVAELVAAANLRARAGRPSPA